MTPEILAANKRGRLILVLGAGCSLQCKNQNDDQMLSGPALARDLADRFGLPITQADEKQLPKVVQVICSNNSRDEVYNYTREKYRCKMPSTTHEILSRIPLQKIYLTNYDDSTELAYNRTGKQVVKTYRIGDFVESPDPLFGTIQIIKLHGCVNDNNNDLIFSISDYEASHSDIPKWYNQLATDCYSQTVVFVGNSLDEPLLFDALHRVSKKATFSRCYVITPEIENLDRLSLESRGFKHIPGTFEDLVTSLESDGATQATPLDVAKRASPELATILNSENDQTREEALGSLSGVVAMRQRTVTHELPPGIRPFYEGFKPTWLDIDNDVTANLDHDESVLNTIREALDSPTVKMVPVIGAAGTGKTTTMMKAARVLSNSNVDAFWVNDNIKDPIKTIRFLEKSHNTGFVLFLPSGPDFSSNIEHAIRNNVIENGVVVIPFYKNAWQSKFKDNFDVSSYISTELGRITELDSTNIIHKLERYGPWTRLAQMSSKSRVEAIYKKSQRQLLVGLIETTNGAGFPEIVRRDLNSLSSPPARSLAIMAALCTMHKHGLPLDLAIDTITSSHPGANFSEILKETAGVCALRENIIVARHPIYARTMTTKITDRTEVLANLSTMVGAFSRYGTPVPKKADRSIGQLFKSLINYRFVNDALQNDKSNVTKFYKALETKFHSDGAFWLQYGLAMRSHNEHDTALKLLDRSLDAYGNSNSNFTSHALGLQHFILADRSDDVKTAQDHMNEAVQILSKLDANSAFDDLYPLTTLSIGHVRCLWKLGNTDEARILARNYYDRVDSFIRTGVSNNKLRELRTELLSLSTTGEYHHKYWSRPFWQTHD